MAADGKTDCPLQGSWYSYGDSTTKNDHGFEKCTSSSHTNSSFGGSSSCDTADDASSSGSFSISSNSNGSLYDLSDIMAQLPIKRGLSKFYRGKSESFTSLPSVASVASIEDLAKKTTAPYRKKLKVLKSHGNGLDRYQPYSNYVKKLAK